MSLIQAIRSRRLDDIINQGYRFNEISSVGTVTDTVVVAAATERTILVTGFCLTTTSSTDVIVTLGFKTGVATTVPFFRGYVRAGGPLQYTYGIGDERYSAPGDALVITTSASGATIFTITGRIIGEKVSLGYIEHAGAAAHQSPIFPPAASGFSSLYRGGYPS